MIVMVLVSLIFVYLVVCFDVLDGGLIGWLRLCYFLCAWLYWIVFASVFCLVVVVDLLLFICICCFCFGVAGVCVLHFIAFSGLFGFVVLICWLWVRVCWVCGFVSEYFVVYLFWWCFVFASRSLVWLGLVVLQLL